LNEEQLTRLRIRLQQKKERLEVTGVGITFYMPKLRRFLHFLTNQVFIAPILEELRANEIGAKDVAEFRQLPRLQAKQVFDRPRTDEDHAALVYHMLRGMCQDNWPVREITSALLGENPASASDEWAIHAELLSPLCEYVEERLDEQQSILGLLVRYKKRCEWFCKKELLTIIESEEAKKGDEKKRAEVEDVLKKDLYRYLHDQGIDFTIEPHSDRGEIDLILDQRGWDRKYLEGKVFDNDNRDAKYVIKGFGQLLHYLRQYNNTRGYLLVYKTCETQLVIEGAEYLGVIPFVRCEGKTIFILVVDICQYEKPVSQRVYKPIRITVDELVKAEPTSRTDAF